MKTKIIFINIIILFIIQNLIAQPENSEKYKTANNYKTNMLYYKALNLYFEIMEEDPDNANIMYNIGAIYNELSNADSAIMFLTSAQKNINVKYTDNYETKTAPIDTWFILGEIYHINYKFEEAIVCFDTLQHYLTNSKAKEIIERKALECKKGIELYAKPTDLSIMPLSGKINSPYLEHSPVLTADLKTMIFTSNRKGTGDRKDENGNYYEDIYISNLQNGQWTEPKSISKNINTEEHEASVGLSVDGRVLYIYKQSNGGDIYESKLENNEWSKPERLKINTNYREAHASISQDGSTLYFSSDRPGGRGGMDIYYCNKKENGQWGRAINLGKSINTPNDEDSPFVNSDDSTLFFSSNGHLGMGGQDLFLSRLLPNNTWSTPSNLGFPVNSTGDDIYYVASPGGGFAFYVSNEYGSYNNTDIYFMMLSNEIRTKVGVFSGQVDLSNTIGTTDTVEIVINIIDPETNDTIKTYYPDPNNGEYTMVLPTDKQYFVNYVADGYVNLMEEIYIAPNSDIQVAKKIVPLQKVILGETNINYGISFLPTTDSLDYQTLLYIDQTKKTLEKYDELVAEISIPKNDSLKNERAKSILSHFNNNDTARVNIKYTDNEYFEILIADTLFLDYHSDNWEIAFKNSIPECETISVLKLEQMNYYLTRNPELFIEFPFSEHDTSELNYLRTKLLFDYFTSHGIDTARLVTKNIYTEEQQDKTNLTIKSSAIGTIPLITILQRYETKQYKQHLINVPVFIKNKNYFSMAHALEIKTYFHERGVDSTRIIFTPYSYTDKDKNITRLKVMKEAKTQSVNSLKADNYVFLPAYSENFVKYIEETPFDNQNTKYVYQYNNNVRTYIPIDKNYKEQPDISKYKPFVDKDCEYLFNNMNSSFFSINFDYNKSETNNTTGLDSISLCLISNPKVKIELGGHSDSKGNNNYNTTLANKRSNYIQKYMLNRGVDTKQLISKSYGENKPIAPNNLQGADFPSGRKINRRVELKVIE